MTKLLIVSSNVHQELSDKQLAKCLEIVKNSNHDFQVESTTAGTYEIPFIINTFHQKRPFDGYIALGLVINKNLDHYDYIMSHIKHCFSHFALNNIPVGNGILSGGTPEELASKIDSEHSCISACQSAFAAVDYLIGLQNKMQHVY